MRKRYTKKRYTKTRYTKKGYTKKRYTKKRQNYYLVGGGRFDSPLKYWNNLFTESEIDKLFQLRTKLQEIMTSGATSSSPKENSICQLMMELLPTYYIPKDIADQPVRSTNRDGTTTNWEAADFYSYYTILCATSLLFGIIASKMDSHHGCNYKLILKGGRAIQVVLREIFDKSKEHSFARTILGTLHQTQDIDVLLFPKRGKTYDGEKIQELSSNISELIAWFLTTPTTTIKILPPTEHNHKINKLSVSFLDGYVAFSDIDFGKVPNPEIYAELQKLKKTTATPETGLPDFPVLFECLSIEHQLTEKIYYYGDYSVIKSDALRKPNKDETLIASCDYFLAKFKKAIISLNNGFQLSRSKLNNQLKLTKANVQYLENKLLYYGFFGYHKAIIESIYGDTTEEPSVVQETPVTPQSLPSTTTSDPHFQQLNPYYQGNYFTRPECMMYADDGQGQSQQAYGQYGQSQQAYGQYGQSSQAFIHPGQSLQAFIHPGQSPQAFIHPGQSPQAYGQLGQSQQAYGQHGQSQQAYGQHGQSPQAYGQLGQSQQAYGQHGQSQQAYGQHGQSPQAYGQHGQSQQAYGQYGQSPQAFIHPGQSSQAYRQVDQSQQAHLLSRQLQQMQLSSQQLPLAPTIPMYQQAYHQYIITKQLATEQAATVAEEEDAVGEEQEQEGESDEEEDAVGEEQEQEGESDEEEGFCKGTQDKGNKSRKAWRRKHQRLLKNCLEAEKLARQAGATSAKKEAALTARRKLEEWMVTAGKCPPGKQSLLNSLRRPH